MEDKAFYRLKIITVIILGIAIISILLMYNSEANMGNIYNVDCPVFLGNDGFLVTSPFGYRVNPISGIGEGHKGIDITRWTGYSNIGTITAFADGKVIGVKNSVIGPDTTNAYNSEGNYVIIEHKNGYVTKYFHLKKDTIKVLTGEEVKEGQIIAEMGTTGNSTGYHLHFQIEYNGNPLDPLPFITNAIKIEGQKDYKPWINQASEWFRNDVNWAVENGIIKGDGSGNYGLKDSITKEQMAAMLHRFYELIAD